MHLKELHLSGFKSFGKKSALAFTAPITAIVGPNGSGKSNVAEAFRFVLGEQSMKSLRGRRGEDLIWNGSGSAPRANRASVRAVFDNNPRLFDVDFDEVAIERVVHRDGVNEYLVNGSAVRLKDVLELLARANVGASGHHIISQGEADRILSAHPRERREMIEDALGLRIYQAKRDEAAKKLEKTRENISQVAALRKEIAPHLAFLKRQMEKLERIERLRRELAERFRDYAIRERRHLAEEGARLEEESAPLSAELARLSGDLEKARAALERSESRSSGGDALLALERDLADVRARKDAATRDLGRLEGEIAAEKRRGSAAGEAAVPLSALEEALRESEKEAAEALRADENALRSLLRVTLDRFRKIVAAYRERWKGAAAEDLAERAKNLAEDLAALGKREAELEEKHRSLRAEVERSKDEGRRAERELYALMARESELRRALAGKDAALRDLGRAREALEREETEAKALLGELFPSLAGAAAGREREERAEQEKRLREIERLKIRIEESGGGAGAEVAKEYEDVRSRDEFLAREIADLERSASSLESLIVELGEKISEEFAAGMEKINAEFKRLFALMFGGGTASIFPLKLRRRQAEEGEGEEEKAEEGVDVSVSIPGKRIRGLEMLSGGERALASIALIFAMSQVNPPPFLVLDETDAALDEANSRRYGDMIEDLAKRSQLVLITHNRETMSRAGILYGVTMGADGMSKLLSVRFDEAVAVAK